MSSLNALRSSFQRLCIVTLFGVVFVAGPALCDTVLLDPTIDPLLQGFSVEGGGTYAPGARLVLTDTDLHPSGEPNPTLQFGAALDPATSISLWGPITEVSSASMTVPEPADEALLLVLMVAALLMWKRRQSAFSSIIT